MLHQSTRPDPYIPIVSSCGLAQMRRPMTEALLAKHSTTLDIVTIQTSGMIRSNLTR